ncbi:MAG: cytochrome c oxidase subunit II [Actinomycetota bacterium]
MRKLKLIGGSIVAVLLLAACSDSLDQSTLNPAGPVAQKQEDLFQFVFWLAVAVFVVVEGALVLFVWKYRHRPGAKPSGVHGNTKLEIGWTIAPAVLLAVITVPTITGIWDLAETPTGPDVIQVDVVGHQWWWEFRYPDQELVTANELVIPTGTQISIRLCAAGASGAANPKTANPDGGVGPQASGPALGAPCVDPAPNLGNAVIHAFWVPRLAGKQDVVPGRTNEMYLSADEPGLYPGQCAEYCDWSHANMRFQVKAVSPEEFSAWLTEQQAEAAVPGAGSLADKGMQDFANGSCIGCHAIKGVEGAAAVQGPDLTHFASRDCFAGCMFPTYNEDGSFNAEAMKAWLEDPPAVKPGSWMPNYHLKPDEVEALIAYLQSLT